MLAQTTTLSCSDANIAYSPGNWYKNGAIYAQTPNPGAYFKEGFTGTSLAINLDVSPLTTASVPAAQYPVVRYSVDNGAPVTVQLTATTTSLRCAGGLSSGKHTLFFQYVSGYVFLDFWTPVNVVRVTGFTVDAGATSLPPFGAAAVQPKKILLFGDSICNADNTSATFTGGVTNAVDTQDAALGYGPILAAAIGAEYAVAAYGGASWDGTAADGHTPGLMTFYKMLDAQHSRLVNGKFPDAYSDIFAAMGENVGPSGSDVLSLLTSLRAASTPQTNLWLIVPFSGRARAEISAGFKAYKAASPADTHTYLIDLGNNPYLPDGGAPTLLSVDGQHPLAALDAQLAAQIIEARTTALMLVSSPAKRD